MRDLIFGAALAVSATVPAAAQDAGVAPAPTAVSPAPASPGAAEKLAVARQIVEIIYPVESRERTFGSAIANITAQSRMATAAAASADPGLKRLIDEFVSGLPATLMPTVRKHIPDLIEAQAVAYTHVFSLSELKDIHAFAVTPSGRHYLSGSTGLLGDPAVTAANVAYLREVQQVAIATQREFGAKVDAYLKAHPDVAAKLKAEAAARANAQKAAAKDR